MASKLVVVGEVNGRFTPVFAKLAEIQPKHQFAFALVAGNLFAHPETTTPDDDENIKALLDGKLEIPVTTYFALGDHPLPPAVVSKLQETDGEELCTNLHFLGKRTVIKTSEGIRIVALGGQLDPNITGGVSGDKYTPFFNEADAKALKGAHSADILVTAQWPAGVRNRSGVAFDPVVKEPVEQQCIANLCATLKPRYHFSTLPGASYEREPFFFDKNDDGAFPITRFVNLAEFGNTTKQKWIFAFSLDPKAPLPMTAPVGATVSPLLGSEKKRPVPDGGYTSRLAYSDDHDSRRHHKRRRGEPKKPLTETDCFFCLGNENIPIHLVVSIGENAYITIPKGPLPTASTFPKLGFPGHLLIIPLEHKPTFASMDEDVRVPTYTEMQRYRSSLNKMVKSITSEEFGSVTWEISKSSLIHTHWQYLPVPISLIRTRKIEAAFKVLAKNLQYPPFVEEDVGDGIQENSDFFRFWVWDPKNGEDVVRSWVLRFDEGVRFHMQFGREVMGKLLGLDSRIDWKACGQTEAEEEADAARVKEVFGEFDFSQ